MYESNRSMTGPLLTMYDSLRRGCLEYGFAEVTGVINRALRPSAFNLDAVASTEHRELEVDTAKSGIAVLDRSQRQAGRSSAPSRIDKATGAAQPRS